jgi:hypothetical protein
MPEQLIGEPGADRIVSTMLPDATRQTSFPDLVPGAPAVLRPSYLGARPGPDLFLGPHNLILIKG